MTITNNQKYDPTETEIGQHIRTADQGAALLNVLLVAVLISVFIAAALVLLNTPEKYFTANLNQTQAYYNAQAGLLVGEDKVSAAVSQSDSLAAIENFSWSYKSAAWNINIPFPTVSGHPPSYKVTFQIISWNKISTLSESETVTVNVH